MTWFKPGVIGCYRYSYDLRVLFNWFRTEKRLTVDCSLAHCRTPADPWSKEKRWDNCCTLTHCRCPPLQQSTRRVEALLETANTDEPLTRRATVTYDLHIISHMYRYRIRNTDCPTELCIFILSLHWKAKSSYDVVSCFACVPEFAPSTQTAPATPRMSMPDYRRTIVVYIIYITGRPPCPFQPKETRLWYLYLYNVFSILYITYTCIWSYILKLEIEQMLHRPLSKATSCGRAGFGLPITLSSFSAWVSSCDRDWKSTSLQRNPSSFYAWLNHRFHIKCQVLSGHFGRIPHWFPHDIANGYQCNDDISGDSQTERGQS